MLGIATVLELIYVMRKFKNRRLATAFYLTLLGVTLNFETSILIFLKAYSYQPKILVSHPVPFDDVLAGNVFSQTSVAASVLLVTVLHFHRYWYLILAFGYGLVEEAFLALGVYSHNWYRTWMTVLGVPLFCWLAGKMYAACLRGLRPTIRYVYTFLALFPLYVVIIVWGLMLLRLQEFNAQALSDPIWSRHLLALIHFWLLSASTMLMYFLRLSWRWKALIFAAEYAFYYWTYRAGMIWIKDGLFLPVATLSIFSLYFSVVLMDWLYEA
ncbi:MAG TPA: hypothetical protein VD902_10000 [Symbiobacteriaceae bacterium]|nr:hypothetical protein [Symbiobacteriaceae bacterium]